MGTNIIEGSRVLELLKSRPDGLRFGSIGNRMFVNNTWAVLTANDIRGLTTHSAICSDPGCDERTWWSVGDEIMDFPALLCAGSQTLAHVNNPDTDAAIRFRNTDQCKCSEMRSSYLDMIVNHPQYSTRLSAHCQ